MNTMQMMALRHLSSGTADREKALEDLYMRSAFSPAMTETETRNVITSYITENPRGFCPAGINRFREAVGIAKKPTRIVEIELKIEVEDYPQEHADGRFMKTIRGLFEPDKVLHGINGTPSKIVGLAVTRDTNYGKDRSTRYFGTLKETR